MTVCHPDANPLRCLQALSEESYGQERGLYCSVLYMHTFDRNFTDHALQWSLDFYQSFGMNLLLKKLYCAHWELV